MALEVSHVGSFVYALWNTIEFYTQDSAQMCDIFTCLPSSKVYSLAQYAVLEKSGRDIS